MKCVIGGDSIHRRESSFEAMIRIKKSLKKAGYSIIGTRPILDSTFLCSGYEIEYEFDFRNRTEPTCGA